MANCLRSPVSSTNIGSGRLTNFSTSTTSLTTTGKRSAIRNLDELRETLRPILLRRTRAEVAKQLPDRTDEIVRIAPTAEQLEIHDGQMQVVAQIIRKKYFTEMDRLRLQKALLLARMSADSTFLVDKEEPEYSTKLERLGELLDGLIEDPTRKIVLFSEWRRMLDRIEKKLDAIGCDYVRLDGQVPQKKRPEIVAKFQNDPECRVILMTNAGSTGLNLQAANTVINVDLPWNPAVLEQRIARAYRMGQKNPVHVYKLVTADTIEERLLETLASKQDLADAAIDFDSDVESVAMVSGMEDLKRRLEKMIGPAPAAPVDRKSATSSRAGGRGDPKSQRESIRSGWPIDRRGARLGWRIDRSRHDNPATGANRQST